MIPGFWLYAIGRAEHPLPERVEAIDGSERVERIVEAGLAAFATPIDLEEYTQAAIDARAGDVEWLGAIGYRHQGVMAALMREGTIIPLRAFTLHGSDTSVRARLAEDHERFTKMLERLDGKQEWTLKIELEPERWSEALTRRVGRLRELVDKIAAAASGAAFLLRKKLDAERKSASKEAEDELVAEIERAVLERLVCETVAESRQQREGAFPQLNVLINRDEEATLQEIADDLGKRYAEDGVTVAVSGPWPPYTFATES